MPLTAENYHYISPSWRKHVPSGDASLSYLFSRCFSNHSVRAYGGKNAPEDFLLNNIVKKTIPITFYSIWGFFGGFFAYKIMQLSGKFEYSLKTTK